TAPGIASCLRQQRVVPTVDGTLTVRAGVDGARTVELSVAGQTMTADVSAGGLVTRARVPAQGVEVRPDTEPAPVVTYPAAPAGITEEAIEVDRGGVAIRGVIWRPANVTGPLPVMVIVAGSGPTDREGNSVLNLHTDCYRLLADSLAARGIATVRFDKRGVGASGANFRPQDVSFDDVVGDAQAIVERVRADARFSHVTLAGHSEGGLIALRVAERVPVNALVLLASMGRPFGVILREQLARQLSATDMAEFDRVVGEIRAGRPTTSTVAAIQSTLNPSLNLNYMRGELDADPAALLRALRMPTVVIQGDTDIQVTVADARALAGARPDVRLVLLPHVNHVLRDEATATPDQASYHNPALPLGPGVLDAVYSGIAGTAPAPVAHPRGRRR
ncbi:MAG: alpha/beta fold hydrolase, partial [Deltaproteobacteria bacterium]